MVLDATAVYCAWLEEDLVRSPAVFGATYDAYMGHTDRFFARVAAVGPWRHEGTNTGIAMPIPTP